MVEKSYPKIDLEELEFWERLLKDNLEQESKSWSNGNPG